MKSFLFALLLLVLFAVQSQAQCQPWEIELSQGDLKGCGEDWLLYKARNLRITFPDGFSIDRNPDGHGSCGQATSCDALTGFSYSLGGLTECWPQFDAALRSEGIWSQTVHNRLAVPQLHQCSGSSFIAGPIVCTEHPTARARTTTIVHSCPLAGGRGGRGGGGGWPAPSPPTNPCYWPSTFFPGREPCLPDGIIPFARPTFTTPPLWPSDSWL